MLPPGSNTNEATGLIGVADSVMGVRFRFTDFPALAGPPQTRLLFNQLPASQQYNNYLPSSLSVRDCTLNGSILNFGSINAAAETNEISNNIFYRSHLILYPASANPLVVTLRNNLFYFGSNILQNPSGNGVVTGEARENVFQGTSFGANINPANLALSHNAYVHATGAPNFGESIRTVLTNFNYASGTYGPWYQGDTTLVDLGQRTATAAGLYHHTTRTSQVEEANTLVDVGVHYPSATTASSLAYLWEPTYGATAQPILVNWNTPVGALYTTSPATVTWDVTTSLDSAVKRVEFYVRDTLIGTRTSPPWQWTNVLGGSIYSVWVRVVGTNDSAWNSIPRRLRIPANQPPSVSWLSPVSGTVLSAGTSNVILSATATDTDGTIANVAFFANGVQIGQTSAPATGSTYSINWTSLQSGTSSVFARAFDNGGNSNSTAPISLTVPNTPPSVGWLTPTAGSTLLYSPTNIILSVTATDTGGTITNVAFYEGATLLGQVATPITNTTYSLAWLDQSTAGSPTVKAVATDNQGATNSATVNFTLNALPNLTWVAPSGIVKSSAPASVPLQVNASDSDGQISKVEFFEFRTTTKNATTNVLIATVPSANIGANGYSTTWNTSNVGQHSVFARATDNRGAYRLSEFRVIELGPVPEVTILGPINGTKLPAYSSTVIQAQASISSGQIAYVEFYAGTNFLGRDTTAGVNAAGNPNIFEQELNGLAPGTYELTARAFDASNPPKKRSSAVVTVTVDRPKPTPNEGRWDPCFAILDIPFYTTYYSGASLAMLPNSVLAYGRIDRQSGGDHSLYTHNSDCVWAVPFDAISGSSVLVNKVIPSMIVRDGALYGTGQNGARNVWKFQNGNLDVIGNKLFFSESTFCPIDPFTYFVSHSDSVLTIIFHNSNLIIGGDFIGAEIDTGITNTAVRYVARFDSSTSRWAELGTNRLNGRIRALANYRGEIYAGGNFTSAGTNVAVKYIAHLVGQSWQPVGDGVNGPVLSLHSSGGRLFIGGEFKIVGGYANANCVATWDGLRFGTIANGIGAALSTLPGDPCGLADRVVTLAVRGPDLFVGGQFNQANNTSGDPVVANRVARATWNEVDEQWTWSPLGTGLWHSFDSSDLTIVRSIIATDHAYDSGFDVVVAGHFDRADGLTAINIARWVYGGFECATTIPTVTITAPTNNASFANNLSTFSASASVPSGSSASIASEAFYLGVGEGLAGSLGSGTSTAGVWNYTLVLLCYLLLTSKILVST